MKEYHKIVTVFERDPETRFKTLLDGKFADPAFEFLRNNQWGWTEKVDGTNIRVMWDGSRVTFGGKTDAAQIYAPLIERLQTLFYAGAMERFFGTEGNVCLYGEGFGAKIQKGGGNYKSDGVDFVLFDVRIGDVWLERSNVGDIAQKLGIEQVPLIGVGTLDRAIRHTRDGFNSVWGSFKAEGLVMRPLVELKDRLGHRIITKIKHKDFA